MSDKKYFMEYSYVLNPNGHFPNSHLPVLLYKNVLDLPALFPAGYIENLFKSNNWYNSWKSGIHTYDHYHSNTHEVLGVFKGEATIQLGGETGTKVRLEKGDVLIIPAGVAHKNLDGEDDISCIGAYPDGAKYNMHYGTEEELPAAHAHLAEVTLPERDPVLGLRGGTSRYWKKAQASV